MNRQGKNLSRRLLSLRQSPPSSDVRVPIKRCRMYGRGIVDPCLDVLVPELIHNLVPLCGVHTSQANCIQVPAVFSAIGLFRQEQFSSHAQFLGDQLSILPPLFKEREYLLQLRVTDRCSNLGHVIIVTWPNGPVWTLFSMGTNHSQSLSISIIVCSNHTSFAGCDILASVETETCHVGNGTDPLAVKLSPVRLGRIFNYDDVFAPGQARDGCNVRRKPVEICGDDRFRLS